MTQLPMHPFLGASSPVTSLRMPVMDGFEATKIIKEQLKLDVPVIALTADAGFDTRERCSAIGFNDFAMKPLQFSQLASLLQKHLGHEAEPA